MDSLDKWASLILGDARYKKRRNLLMNEVIKKDPQMLATVRVAMDVQSDSKFIELVQKTAQIQITHQPGFVVNDSASEGIALDSILALNRVLKDAKAMIDKAIAFPKLYTQCVKNVFEPIIPLITGIKQELNEKVLKHRERVIAETAATISTPPAEDIEAALGNESGAVTVLKTSEDGKLLPPKPAEGEQAKAHTHTTQKLIVTNKFEFLKLIISKTPRNEWATPDLIEVNEGAILKAMNGSKKRKLPDCLKIEKVKTLVTKEKPEKK